MLRRDHAPDPAALEALEALLRLQRAARREIDRRRRIIERMAEEVGREYRELQKRHEQR